MQKISTCLWFNNQAEEAVRHYTSIFKNSRILDPAFYNEEGYGEPGTVMTIPFELEGREFLALNGGPEFNFTNAISFMVNCESQEEIDYYWDKLTKGGQESQCGWLKDKYGLSWQIVPSVLGEMLQDKDPEKSNRVMQAMLQMTKIDIEALRRAYETK